MLYKTIFMMMMLASASAMRVGVVKMADTGVVTPTGAGSSVMVAPLPANVGEAKDRFYGSYGGALPMGIAAFVNEMIQSTTFAMASPQWEYSRVYALGLNELCDEFLSQARAEGQADKVRASLCVAFGYDSDVIRADGDALKAAAKGKDAAGIFALDDLKAIAANGEANNKGAVGAVKYTYTFGAGLVGLMQQAEIEPKENIKPWCDELNLKCEGAFSRDYAYYEMSIKKLADMKELMVQMKASADRDKANREEAKAKAAAGEAPKEDTSSVPKELRA